uniref:Uncharacterized protein n=1 Tax=Osugoroshi virus TaxID=2202814 RepID=A0A7R7T211_9VIRU|nr:hypothetical protein [Osugoroshi virus]
MIYTFNNEEIVDVVMFKKILPTDVRATFQMITKYAGLLNAPPDSVLYHKTLVFLKHLRYRYHVYSFDSSPTAKQFCQAYETTFPDLKVEAISRPPFPLPPIEWEDEVLDEVVDDGTLLPIECEQDVESDSYSEVELEKCESTDVTSDSHKTLRSEQQDPAFIAYSKKISNNKRIVKESAKLLEAGKTIPNTTKDLPQDQGVLNAKKPKKKVSCSPSYGMQFVRAVFGYPVKYAAKGVRVARRLLGLSDDCEAHLYVDHFGIYYACGGDTEIDCIRAVVVKDRQYHDQHAYAYKGSETTMLLMACDVSVFKETHDVIQTSHGEALGWDQHLKEWVNHLIRDGHSRIT